MVHFRVGNFFDLKKDQIDFLFKLIFLIFHLSNQIHPRKSARVVQHNTKLEFAIPIVQ